MLSPISYDSIRARLAVVGPTAEAKFDYAALFGAMSRHKIRLCAWLVFCVAGAVLYLVLAPPEYTAYTQVLLETPKVQRVVVDEDGQPAPMDSAQADSRIQVIKSERLLRFVFETRMPSFKAKEQPSAWRWLGSLILQKAPVSEKEQTTKAFLDFMDRVGAKRIGLSYVMEISYRARSPADAAETANAIAAAYVRDRVLSGPNGTEVLQRRTADVMHDAEAWLSGVKAGSIPTDPVSIVDARVIGAAIEPLGKSSPHGLLVVLFAFSIGLTTGVGAIFVVHCRDRTIRSERQARVIFGSHLLAVVRTGEANCAYANTCTMLSDKKSAKIGIVSWQSRTSTACIARGLAETLASTERVTLLHDEPKGSIEGSPFVRSLLSDKDARSKPTCRINRAPAESLLVEPVNFDRKSGSWIFNKERRPIFFDAIAHRGHTILALPPATGSLLVMKSIREFLDGFILVLEKDTASLDDARSVLDMLHALDANLMGVVLYAIKDETGSSIARFRSLFAHGGRSVRSWRARVGWGRVAARAEAG